MPLTFSLLAISDRHSLQASTLSFADWLRALGAAGIGAVQIREKDLEDGALYDLARPGPGDPASRHARAGQRPRRHRPGGRRDGAHLPADGLPAAPLKARFGPGLLLGRSAHTVEDVARACDEGVAYVVFGPVYSTPGKGEPVGLAALARAVLAAAVAGIPVFALGGVTLERLAELAAAGAAGVAAIRLFQHPADLESVAGAAREQFGRM